MTNEEYEATQTSLQIIAGMTSGLDLDGFLRRNREADSVGAILDPTLYRAASRKLALVRRLAESLLPAQKEVKRQRLVSEMAIQREVAP